MSSEESNAIYFISVASTLSGIHQQTIRTYEEKGLIKPFRTGGGTRRYSQEDIDKLIQIQNLSQRGINLDGIKIIYEMRDKIEELQAKLTEQSLIIESSKKEIGGDALQLGATEPKAQAKASFVRFADSK